MTTSRHRHRTSPHNPGSASCLGCSLHHRMLHLVCCQPSGARQALTTHDRVGGLVWLCSGAPLSLPSLARADGRRGGSGPHRRISCRSRDGRCDGEPSATCLDTCPWSTSPQGADDVGASRARCVSSVRVTKAQRYRYSSHTDSDARDAFQGDIWGGWRGSSDATLACSRTLVLHGGTNRHRGR